MSQMGSPGAAADQQHGPIRSLRGRRTGRMIRLRGSMADQLARSRNLDRQKRLVADTEKLLSLATS